MKTIILYATKYGAAEEISKRIAAQIENADTYDLKQENPPPLSNYDCVIIGSSVYAGSFRKEAKSYLAQNADELTKKKIALFICAMGDESTDEILKTNVPDEVVQAATATATLGGVFDPKKANFFERLIMKIVTKQSGPLNRIDKINNEKINTFTEAIKA